MLTRTNVEELLAQSEGPELMVSCYADLSVVHGSQSLWEGPFKAQKDQIKRMLADEPRVWHSCQHSLEDVRAVLQSAEARAARGMAVFSAHQRGFFRAFPLEVPVPTQLVVHQAPYLVPLLEVLLSQREYLAVHTDTHRGRIYAVTPGAVRLLDELEEEVIKKQRSSGELCGTQQPAIARRRENQIQHYFKELAALVEKLWAGNTSHGIILLGEHEVLAQLRPVLPARLTARIAAEAPLAWSREPLTSSDAIRGALDAARRAEMDRVLDEVRDRLEQGYAVAAGPEAVLEALQNGRLGPQRYGYLVLGPDPRDTVARCTSCGTLSMEVGAPCPRCQAPCKEASLWEEILLFAMRHDLTAYRVADSDLPARTRGVAAVLPRPEPTKAAPREEAVPV